jgi:ribonuclease P protein component
MTATPSENQHAKTGPFVKSSRLLKHADFDRVYRTGKRHFSANITVFWVRQGLVGSAGTAPKKAAVPHGPRIGFTVGKALGGAVVRNRIKRRLREAVRMNLSGFSSPVDVVINPKKSAATAELPKLKQEVSAAFRKIAELPNCRTAELEKQPQGPKQTHTTKNDEGRS